MVTMPVLLAALIALAPPPPGEQPSKTAQTPVSYIVYVGGSPGGCSYATGDVIFDARGFREDLKERFDRSNGIIIYHQPDVRPGCLATARHIVRSLRFRIAAVEEAPKDLDMGPPR